MSGGLGCSVVLLLHTIPWVAGDYLGSDSHSVKRRFGLRASSHQEDPSEGLIYARPDGLSGQLLSNSTVELMRFVTAYKAGIEAAVDITPYSQLLRSAAKAGNLSLYSFIDTYVGPNSSKQVNHILYQNNITGKCYMYNTSEGNGWQLHAYLTFWPRKSLHNVSTQPQEQVMLSSGYYGGIRRIGEVSMVEGELSDDGDAVLLEGPIGIDPNTKLVEVWGCQDAASAQHASWLGYIARQVELFTRHGNPAGVDMLMDDTFQTLLWQNIAAIEVTSINNISLTVQGTYNTSTVTLEPGMPVFYDESSMFTDVNLSGTWVNTSLPLHRVGNVTFVSEDGNVTLRMEKPCFPEKSHAGLPSLLVPSSPAVINKSRALLDAIRLWGISVANESMTEVNGSSSSSERMLLSRTSSAGSQMYFLKPLIAAVDPERTLDLEEAEHLNDSIVLDSFPLFGRLNISATPQLVNGTKTWMPILTGTTLLGLNRTDGQKVCAVAQKQHGHLFSKRFNLSNLQQSDKVIYQLAVTGHGWQSTTEQCGEFCHAVYRLTLNGKDVANVTQFRDDCMKNPINGSFQHGTWEIPRNGWCPGTVEPGLFMDLTHASQHGENSLSVHVLVWSNATLSYEPYTDYGGFVDGDAAWLTVGLSVFVYNHSAVAAIQQQPKAFTAAEAAIRSGSSHPSSLRPPEFVVEALSLLELGDKQQKSGRPRTGKRAQNAERRAKPSFSRSLKKHRPTTTGFLGGSVHSQKKESILKATKTPVLMRSELKADAANEIAAIEVRAAAMRHLHPDSGTDSNATSQNTYEGSDLSAYEDRYDFEATAPWYLYNSTEGDPLQSAGTTRVTLFNRLYVTGGNRDNSVHIPEEALPKDWAHVALHFQLSKPQAPLDYDHWDREGSFGFRLR